MYLAFYRESFHIRHSWTSPFLTTKLSTKKANPMQNLRQMKARSQHLVVRFALVAMSVFILFLAPTTALASPPATDASCQGIKNAYPILGTQCQNNYAKINHSPANAAERLATFNARVAVLEIFQKALLCNGMWQASQLDQQKFKNGESGHLTALKNLRAAMTAAQDQQIPPDYTEADLKSITIKKQQCK
jgi:hypothetical protein